jgi:hypothetical protein
MNLLLTNSAHQSHGLRLVSEPNMKLCGRLEEYWTGEQIARTSGNQTTGHGSLFIVYFPIILCKNRPRRPMRSGKDKCLSSCFAAKTFNTARKPTRTLKSYQGMIDQPKTMHKTRIFFLLVQYKTLGLVNCL